MGVKTQRFVRARLNGLPGVNGPSVGGMMAWEVVDAPEDGTGCVGFLSMQVVALEAAKHAWQLNAKGSSFVSTTLECRIDDHGQLTFFRVKITMVGP